MARTSKYILRCFDCKKIVGDTKKNDGVVHVDMSACQRYEIAYNKYEKNEATRECPECNKHSIVVFDKFFHLDGTEVSSCWKKNGGSTIIFPHIVSLREILALPDPAPWQIHCMKCNPHYDAELDSYCNGCYWFDADRCATIPQLVDWTAHLSTKAWIKSTNWFSFIKRLNGRVDA